MEDHATADQDRDGDERNPWNLVEKSNSTSSLSRRVRQRQKKGREIWTGRYCTENFNSYSCTHNTNKLKAMGQLEIK